MELKIAGAMSLELAEILDELNIRKTSFSKYGRGYLDYMYGASAATEKELREDKKIAIFPKAV